ncbi:hypothetical protein ACQ4PT_043941 [Festuca glaucescens]
MVLPLLRGGWPTNRSPLFVRLPLLRLAAAAASAVLSPSAAAAFLRRADGAAPLRLFRLLLRRLPVFLRPAAGAPRTGWPSNRRRLLIRLLLLRRAAAAVPAVLFPSAAAAFLSCAGGAAPVRLLRVPLPVFVRPDARALLKRHLRMTPSLLMDVTLLLPVIMRWILLCFLVLFRPVVVERSGWASVPSCQKVFCLPSFLCFIPPSFSCFGRTSVFGQVYFLAERHYNSLFAFTSMGADIDKTINSGGAPYVFKMSGSVFHRMGSLLPHGDESPKFAQLYMIDSADQLQRRLDLFGQEDVAGETGSTETADPLIVRELTDMLNQHNHLLEQFRYLSACEACWRMFGYDIQGRQPSVERLVVHLPGMNRVIFHEDTPLGSLVDNSFRYKTMLTEWFVANQRHVDARALTYLDFPTGWVWDASNKWVLDVGNGDVPSTSIDGDDSGSWIPIPDDLLLRLPSSNVHAAIESVYDSFFFNYSSPEYLAERAIMCPTNAVVDEINDSVFQRVPGCSRRYLSCDSISKSTDHVSEADLLYPPEFLHSVTINNFPHHELNLKVGVPVMLLRNINQSLGLCNGTRLLVVRLGERVLEGEIISGSHKGRRVCIPRIVLNSVDSKWPFTLRRCQSLFGYAIA